jgi:hypothetical protein
MIMGGRGWLATACHSLSGVCPEAKFSPSLSFCSRGGGWKDGDRRRWQAKKLDELRDLNICASWIRIACQLDQHFASTHGLRYVACDEQRNIAVLRRISVLGLLQLAPQTWSKNEVSTQLRDVSLPSDVFWVCDRPLSSR